MNFRTRIAAHFFNRSNWWGHILLVWVAFHWKFGVGDGIYAPSSNAFAIIATLVGYFAISPAFFFALAGVNPYAASRSWGYLVEATWPIYVLDHIANLAVLTLLYWLLDAPFGWGMFLPITQTIYLTFYAARGCARRIGYYKFDDEI